MPDNQQRNAAHQEIVAVLDAVAGVENVYNRKRNMVPPAQFMAEALEQNTESVQAWFVSRVGTRTDSRETSARVPFGRLLRTHTFQIDGYYSFREDPEDLSNNTDGYFQDLVDDVISAFNEKASLGERVFTALPIQLVRLDYDFLGDAMCHYAQLNIQAIEDVSGLNRV